MGRLVSGLLVGALLFGSVTASAALLPQDDAGSGQDAPGSPVQQVRIRSGQTYQGALEGVPTDSSDHYWLAGEAGDRVEVLADGALGCVYLYHANGTELAFSCSVAYTELTRLQATLPEDGTYYVEYTYLQAQAYAFSLGVNEAASAPLPTSGVLVGPGGLLPDVSASSQQGEHTVVAVVDTGINPYHDFFAAPGLDDPPGEWLAGFDENASALNLTLEAETYSQALDADENVWDSLERSTHRPGSNTFDEHVYTFPGTRIVAGISFGEYTGTMGSGGNTPILDEHGHGTGSAGLAMGASLEEASGDVLLAAVEVGQGNFEDGIFWAAQQPWIDAVTVSLGTVANVPYPTEPVGYGNDVEHAMRLANTSGKPVYVASGNGFSGTGLAADHCSTYTSSYTGPPPVTRIGAAEPGTDNPSTWHCVPVEAIAQTPAPSTGHRTTDGRATHTGTSAATPNAIGHWAHLMQRVREAGIDATRKQVNAHLLHAARPAEPGVGLFAEPSTPATAPLDQGYGVVDEAALERAWTRLDQDQPPADRSPQEAFFAVDQRVRETLWGPGGVLTGDGFQSSSGSRSDAPSPLAGARISIEGFGDPSEPLHPVGLEAILAGEVPEALRASGT